MCKKNMFLLHNKKEYCEQCTLNAKVKKGFLRLIFDIIKVNRLGHILLELVVTRSLRCIYAQVPIPT